MSANAILDEVHRRHAELEAKLSMAVAEWQDATGLRVETIDVRHIDVRSMNSGPQWKTQCRVRIYIGTPG
jgi:hypothetical protein